MKKKSSILKFLASLKLAVIILISMAIITAVGTIVEAQYDATIAAKWVYHTFWMYGILGALSVNLIAVMVDRWPWQPRHVAFLLAHIGILIILIGAWVTQQFGVDGSMRFGIGEKSRLVTVGETELTIYSSFDGDNFSKVFDQPVDFFKEPPESKPILFSGLNADIKVKSFDPFVLATERIVPTQESNNGAALRFTISNANVNVTQWVVQRAKGRTEGFALGPAQVVLGEVAPGDVQGNTIQFIPQGDKLKYVLHNRKSEVKPITGVITEGGEIQTQWMGLKIHILSYYPQAKRTWVFKSLERPVAGSTSTITLEFQGQDHQIQLNDIARFFTDNAAYIVRYSNRMVDIGEDLELLKFEIGRYQGTMRAMSYQSLVKVPELGEVLISMNEPLKYKGYTFYQASFEEDERGQPKASILSVNYDPGRWIKYLGSLLIVLGTIHLFWFKKWTARKNKSQGVSQ